MSHHGCFLSKTPFTPLQKEDPPPARAWPLPQLFTISLIVLRPSTPFCKGKTKVSGPHQGSHCFRHPSASAALQPSMMTSATNFSSLSKAWESKIGPSCEAGTWGELQTFAVSCCRPPVFLGGWEPVEFFFEFAQVVVFLQWSSSYHHIIIKS